MAGLYCSKSDEEHSDMSNGAVIRCRLQTNDGWILHGECQKPRKSTLGACSAIIASFKRLRAIVERFSDIGISPKIGNAAFKSRKRVKS